MLLLLCPALNMAMCCREIMHAMWRPRKFGWIYALATCYVLTLTLPDSISMYWVSILGPQIRP